MFVRRRLAWIVFSLALPVVMMVGGCQKDQAVQTPPPQQTEIFVEPQQPQRMATVENADLPDVDLRGMDASKSGHLSDGLMVEGQTSGSGVVRNHGISVRVESSEIELPEDNMVVVHSTSGGGASASVAGRGGSMGGGSGEAASGTSGAASGGASGAASGGRIAVPKTTSRFVDVVESAHRAGRWRRHDAIRFNIHVEFNGKPMLDALFISKTDMSAVRMELMDGSVVVYDGQDVWANGAAAGLPMSRFHVWTWPYFLAAPFKLNDPGTALQIMDALPMRGMLHPAARLTFTPPGTPGTAGNPAAGQSPGVGDTPGNWYIAYTDPRSDWLRAMAYIVTFGKSTLEAEKEPQAILYDDHVQIDGAILSRYWTFWNWDLHIGTHGDPLGHARLTNLEFVRTTASVFTPPADARRVPQP